MTTAKLIIEWLNRVSPVAVLVGLIFATIWANNLTVSTQVLQKSLTDTNAALLKAVERQAAIEKRVTVIETNDRHMEASLAELPRIRKELVDIRVLLAKANTVE